MSSNKIFRCSYLCTSKRFVYINFPCFAATQFYFWRWFHVCCERDWSNCLRVAALKDSCVRRKVKSAGTSWPSIVWIFLSWLAGCLTQWSLSLCCFFLIKIDDGRELLDLFQYKIIHRRMRGHCIDFIFFPCLELSASAGTSQMLNFPVASHFPHDLWERRVQMETTWSSCFQHCVLYTPFPWNNNDMLTSPCVKY